MKYHVLMIPFDRLEKSSPTTIPMAADLIKLIGVKIAERLFFMLL
jgi:hypothetical protein